MMSGCGFKNNDGRDCMRTEQLYYLCETANLGSMNAASEKLHLSQQGLNSALKSLEKDVGYTLFTTSRQGIELTAEGKLVVETAEKVLDLLEQLDVDLKQCSSRTFTHESISIEAAPVVSAAFFPEVFQSISNKYPHIAIMVTEKNPLQIIQSMENMECDLAVVGIQYNLFKRLGYSDVLSKNLVFEPLYDYKLMIAVSEHHPLARYKSLSLKTVLQYPLALLSLASELEEDLNYQWLALYGEPKVKFVTSSREIYFNTLRSGAAIGFFPDSYSGYYDLEREKNLKLIPIKGEESLHTVGYLYNKAHPLTQAMKIIMNELKSFG